MDHDYTPDTPVTFHVELTRGTCQTQTQPLGEFFTYDQIRELTRDDIKREISREHAEWVFEQVQDGACFEIG